MKVALIPPIPDLDLAARGDGVHLLLAHLCSDERYLKFYRHRAKQGDYIILDNSAHEAGVGSPMDGLLPLARRVGAHEVVVPDVLFNRKATVEKARVTFRYLATDKGWRQYNQSGKPRLMMVPQGKSIGELEVCLKELLVEWVSFTSMVPGLVPPPVIGVSKDYEAHEYGPGLLTFVSGPLAGFRGNGVYDVHLLGWANNLWATAAIARHCPWVRSTDSAKPFVYAQAGITLEPGGKCPHYPRRTPDYFTKKMKGSAVEIALRNIEAYKAAARDELIA